MLYPSQEIDGRVTGPTFGVFFVRLPISTKFTEQEILHLPNAVQVDLK